ncbi:ATP-dependent DNA helicase [Peribacillus muralis]|uniref:ATP-dependent DNA helicase n=1 Tax=Peribacillus muralis TaxID=264697 RepID=UPI003D01D60C
MKSKADILFDLFENKLPKYYGVSTIRESQVQMAFDIAEFLQPTVNKKILFVEGPVGTGKSLGVLIPALVDAKHDNFSDRKAIYATSTINLQGQLKESEIPLLSTLGLVKNTIIAKGKSHYYCHVRGKTAINKVIFTPKKNKALEEFHRTAQTGQRSELEATYGLEISDSKWKNIDLKGTKGDCDRCELAYTCPTRNHRRRFRSGENDLTVTNHDQLIVSFKSVLVDSFMEPILPINPGVLIIDEAHHFLENFIGLLETAFTLSSLIRVEDFISSKWKSKWKSNISTISSWEKKLREKSSGESGRYTIPDYIQDNLSKLKDIVDDSLISLNGTRGDRLEDCSETLELFVNNNYTCWLNLEDGKYIAIPKSFRSNFKELLNCMTRYNKVIFMSGTLTVGGDFNPLLTQWGLREDEVITKGFESPFDYENQAIVYTPQRIVGPNHKDFLNQANNEVDRLLTLTEGRTLLLNTSKEHMNGFYRHIKPRLDKTNTPVYLQGDSGIEKLTRQFKEVEESVLVGSGSFFSGFSVSGPALTSVVLNRLPYPAHNDPVLNLMGTDLSGEEFFKQITFHYMVNKLNQAAGRLIRSITDYGIFTLLDARMYGGKYGDSVQKLLKEQGYKLTQSWDEVVEFYKIKVRNGAEAEYKPYSRDSIEVSDVLNKKSEKKRLTELQLDIEEAEEAEEKAPDLSRRRLKKEQKEFMENLCKKEGINERILSSPISAYTKIYNWLFGNWKDVEFLRENFPYRDQWEKDALYYYDRAVRRVFYPKCTKLGCKGNCTTESHVNIEKYLAEKYGATVTRYIELKGYCLVVIEPRAVLMNDEFRPDDVQLSGE